MSKSLLVRTCNIHTIVVVVQFSRDSKQTRTRFSCKAIKKRDLILKFEFQTIFANHTPESFTSALSIHLKNSRE